MYLACVRARHATVVALLLTFAACGESPDAPAEGADDSGAGFDADSPPAPPPSVGHDSGTGPAAADASSPPAPPDGGTTGLAESGAPSSTDASAGPPPEDRTRVVGYLPNYNGSYADWAETIDFSKITHLNLAFADPPKCSGTCTANSDMTFSTGDDGDIAAVVTAAHAAGVKVLISIGGGGGDQQILQFYNAGLSAPLIASLDSWVASHDLDGVDLDIESPNNHNKGPSYLSFVSALTANFHPQGKLVTAAIAQWIEDGMTAAESSDVDSKALPQFDFINIMNYSDLASATSAMKYYSSKVPAAQVTLGVPFYGSATKSNGDETDEPEYADILKNYPNAWQTDEVSGGSFESGEKITYVGEATMAKETQLGKQYGGIMIWELTGDAPAPHSLFTIIQNNL